MTDNLTDILQLRFEGNGINPDLVKPSEICDIIIELQNGLLATIKHDYPEINTENVVLFSLDGIRNESIGINLKALSEKLLPQVKGAVISSFVLFASSIATNDVSALPSTAVQSLKKISTFSKKHGCNGHFNHNNELISTITPVTEIREIKAHVIKSSINIYGEVTEVGNNIHIKLNEGYIVYVNTNKATSKKLALKLWENIGLRGIAKWDIETFKISEFKLSEILDYEPGSITDAFNKLKEGDSGWDKFNNNDEINKQLFRD